LLFPLFVVENSLHYASNPCYILNIYYICRNPVVFRLAVVVESHILLLIILLHTQYLYLIQKLRLRRWSLWFLERDGRHRVQVALRSLERR